MPRRSERNLNSALGDMLQGMLSGSRVRSENTRTIAGSPGLRPDIALTVPGRPPVVLEAEYMPAANAEAEARSRLGLRVATSGRPIEAAVAVRYPAEVGEADDVRSALKEAALSYCVLTGEAGDVRRFPENGWLDGSLDDLGDFVRLVSVPERAVDSAAAMMQDGIEVAASLLDELDKLRPVITQSIAGLLGMANVHQTRRMACAIMANALIFHQRISGMHENVKTLDEVCGPDVPDPQEETLTAWTGILAINYWPIFALAKDILGQLTPGYAALILAKLRETARQIDASGVSNAHDLTGRIFQRLISDRKYLATFYTLPASAALLARLAVAKMKGVDWSDADAIGKLRVGDFACGTGALLSAVYEQVSARHERLGGDPAALHPAMLEEVLYGCDVMPTAIHITGSTLSGVRPDISFNRSRLYTLAYGRQADGSVRIGSLELLESSAAATLFNTGDPARRVSGVKEETAAYIVADIPDEGFDLVIMNPPFTRSTTHEAVYSDTANAAFAAFNATREDQRDMGKRMLRLCRGSCYHGNAGIASAFAALAHKKLRPGGVLALVLPLSAATGLSWSGFRQILGRDYCDLTVLSIAATRDDMSFSSDTGMAECLVIARKLKPSESKNDRTHFASLGRRPGGFASAASIAKNIADREYVRRIEDGPHGGTRLMVGDELAGEMLTTASGDNWRAVRMLDHSVAQTADALSRSKLWLPGAAAALELNLTRLGVIARIGLHHRDITGPAPRGPFDKVAPSQTATYPALWNHNARSETRMVCSPDSQLVTRAGMEAKASEIWSIASRAHLNVEFTFGSQALAAAFTERESMGGRVWPNVTFPNAQFEYAFLIWMNSTLGLLSLWWHSSRQQSSKISVSLRTAETLPMLNFLSLTDAQLDVAESIFDELRNKELKPAYLADSDSNRARLDRRVVCDLLGFDEDTYLGVRHLSAKWCAEPSVHGGKFRPKGVRPVCSRLRGDLFS